MDARKRYYGILRRDLFPLLRAVGFKGSGTTLRRVTSEYVHVFHVQGSQWGGSCCVNLATHLPFLRLTTGQPVDDIRKVRPHHCEFQARLTPDSLADYWWDYGSTEDEAQSSASHLIATYNSEGPSFYAQTDSLPALLERFPPALVDEGQLDGYPGIRSECRAALTLARIAEQLGIADLQREYAEVGLRHAGSDAWNSEFRDLRGRGLTKR